MNNFSYAIISSIIVSIISLVGIVSLAVKPAVLDKIIFMLISFAAGSLVGASFLHILPEIVEHTSQMHVFSWVVTGFVIFFLLEKYFYWRHCHKGEKCEVHPVGYLNLVGDALHNFVDGMFIGSSFYAGKDVGLVAAVAVILHEVPQELGDFGILVYSGFSRSKALILNLIVSLTAIVGVFVGYLLCAKIENISYHILAIVAGGFIYVASCDLIPEIHREKQLPKSVFSLGLFVLGILFIGLIK